MAESGGGGAAPGRPVLVIEHEPDDPPAWFGRWLDDAGGALHVCQPWSGDRVPSTLAGFGGLVVMGGWMSAHQDREISWLAAVKRLLRGAARDGVPALGICLGHQIAALALGGAVARNPRGRQFGVLEVGWLPAATTDPLVGPVASSSTPAPAVHCNDDVVTSLPDGAVLLATAPGGEVQAVRFADTVWGVQWHPEADEPLVRRWVAAGGGALRDQGLDGEAGLAAIDAARAALEAAWRPLAESFATLAARLDAARLDAARLECRPDNRADGRAGGW